MSVRGLVLLALLVCGSACRNEGRRDHTSQDLPEWLRDESSTLTLSILYSPTDAFAMRRLVRVQLRQREGGGFRATLHGDSTDKATYRSPALKVPIHGQLNVRVLLVSPDPRGDTLARTDWMTVRLQPKYGYWVAVSVGDSSGPKELCGPRYTSFPLLRNGILRGDSLLVDIGGMPKTAIC
jgi:hypothetical protein